MRGKMIAQAAKNVDTILAYARETKDAEEVTKIEKSYKNGKIFSMVFIAVFMMIFVGMILLAVNNGVGKYSVVSVKKDGTTQGYVNRKYVELDISAFVPAPEQGKQYAATLDQNQNVTSVMEYQAFKQAQNKKNGMLFCIGFAVILGSFGLYAVLHRRVIAKDWYQLVLEFRKNRLGR